MSYRDEREALRQRVEELEQELASARRQIEESQAVRTKTDRLELELAATQRTLDRIRGELRSGRPLSAPRRPSVSPLIMVLLGVTAWSAAAFGVMFRPAGGRTFHGAGHEERMPALLEMAESMGRPKVPRTEREGSVAAVSGETKLTTGAECSVDVRPARLHGDINCKVRVRCGGELIYGGSGAGFARCEVQDGALVSASDTGSSLSDGDPVLKLDLAAGSAVVSDTGASPREITIRLTDPGKQIEIKL